MHSPCWSPRRSSGPSQQSPARPPAATPGGLRRPPTTAQPRVIGQTLGAWLRACLHREDGWVHAWALSPLIGASLDVHLGCPTAEVKLSAVTLSTAYVAGALCLSSSTRGASARTPAAASCAVSKCGCNPRGRYVLGRGGTAGRHPGELLAPRAQRSLPAACMQPCLAATAALACRHEVPLQCCQFHAMPRDG